MDFGALRMNRVHKIIKDTMRWIKNQAMEFMSGKMDGLIKGIFRMILEMVMVSCLIEKEQWLIKDIGRMDSK